MDAGVGASAKAALLLSRDPGLRHRHRELLLNG